MEFVVYWKPYEAQYIDMWVVFYSYLKAPVLLIIHRICVPRTDDSLFCLPTNWFIQNKRNTFYILKTFVLNMPIIAYEKT